MLLACNGQEVDKTSPYNSYHHSHTVQKSRWTGLLTCSHTITSRTAATLLVSNTRAKEVGIQIDIGVILLPGSVLLMYTIVIEKAMP